MRAVCKNIDFDTPPTFAGVVTCAMHIAAKVSKLGSEGQVRLFTMQG